MDKIFEINKRLKLGLAPVIYTSGFTEEDQNLLGDCLKAEGYKPFYENPTEKDLVGFGGEKESLFHTLHFYETTLGFCRSKRVETKQILIVDFPFFYNNRFLSALKKQEEQPFVLWYLSYPLPQNILFHLLKSDIHKQIGAINSVNFDIKKAYESAKDELHKLDRFEDDKQFDEWERACKGKTL